jgi:hypothetical protein
MTITGGCNAAAQSVAMDMKVLKWVLWPAITCPPSEKLLMVRVLPVDGEGTAGISGIRDGGDAGGASSRYSEPAKVLERIILPWVAVVD